MSRSDLLVGKWGKNLETLPANYVMPPEKRPSHFTTSKEIPVLDLEQESRADFIAKMIKASEEYGIFQVINHGVSEDLMHKTIKLYEEFFELPIEEYENFLTEDYHKSVRLYTSGYDYDSEEFHMWKDTLKKLTYPPQEFIQDWPQKPDGYRELLMKYTDEVRKLGCRILDLLCEGLGLEEGFFRNELIKTGGMVINNYPSCPEPELAMGMHGHCDPYTLTIIQQEVYGLQIKNKDGQWLGVEPLPNAFVILIPYQLQVLSNDKLRSCIHQAVSSRTARISIATNISPSIESIIGPAEERVSDSDPPRFKKYKYIDFLKNYLYALSIKNLCNETALGPYML